MRFPWDRSKTAVEPAKAEVPSETPTSSSKNRDRWIRISIYANVALIGLIVLAAGGGYVVHLSNTDPGFCASCHVMQSNVSSYLTSDNLDHVHQESGVLCKDCHDYPIPAELDAGIKFLTGNYEIDESGALLKRTFDDTMCLNCHVSYENVASQTDFLFRNPHDNHNGQLVCSTCHVSHGEQIDFCSTCHDNGGQRITGQLVMSREHAIGVVTTALNIPHDLTNRDDCLACHTTGVLSAPIIPQNHTHAAIPSDICQTCHLPAALNEVTETASSS